MKDVCPVCRQPGCPHWELRRAETWHPPVEPAPARFVADPGGDTVDTSRREPGSIEVRR